MLSLIPKPRFMMKIHCFDQKLFCTSPPLVPLQLPSQRETHLWYVVPDEVKNESLLKQYFDLLSPFEKENVSRMCGDKLKKGAVLARALVRITIARYQTNSQVSPRSLKFKKNAHGKPEVLWHDIDDWRCPPLHFNLSHTSSLLACGITTDSPIGVDVEEKQRTTKTNILSFARRYFSHEEVENLTAILDPEVQRQEFIKLWTLKEAFVKAMGTGFSGAPFNTFTIRCNTANRGSFHHPANSNSEESTIVIEPLDKSTNLTTNWQFALLELENSHYAAVCRGKDTISEGEATDPVKMTVWKTIPLVEDLCVSGTDKVVTLANFT